MFPRCAVFHQTRCKIVVRLQVHRIALPLRSQAIRFAEGIRRSYSKW
jgi:hypothetical protein